MLNPIEQGKVLAEHAISNNLTYSELMSLTPEQVFSILGLSGVSSSDLLLSPVIQGHASNIANLTPKTIENTSLENLMLDYHHRIMVAPDIPSKEALYIEQKDTYMQKIHLITDRYFPGSAQTKIDDSNFTTHLPEDLPGIYLPGGSP